MRRLILAIVLTLGLMTSTASATSLIYIYSKDDLAGTIASFPTLKSMGIDVILDYQYPNNANYQQIMDAAAAAGLKVLINVQPWTHFIASEGDFGGYCVAHNSPNLNGNGLNAGGLAAIIDQWKNHPALYGYYTDDESTGTNYNISSRQSVYSFIKSRDTNPAHVVYEAHYDYFSDAYAPTGTHDIYGIDSYPYSDYDPYTIGGSETATLDAFQAILHKFVAYKSQDKIFPVLQGFSDGTTDGGAAFYLPTAGAQSRMWARAQAEGMDYWGVMWFIWWKGNAGWRTIDDYSWLQAEVQTIARAKSDSYETSPIPAVSRATMSASFR